MSDGFDTGADLDYGHFEAGADSADLEQLHTASGSEADYSSDFNVYEQDTESAESTDFQQGSHVEIDNPDGGHYEETNFTNYSNDQFDSSHIFAAEGSEQGHEAQFDELDALRQSFNSEFAAGTELQTDGGGHPGVASN
ncbi:hypothetical protein KZZ52_50705 [Dactylosporangium sp. AC04546]|uniref:hypothetical protein n=1 Tax=Dactylosporangium sp. AC04546 TaxID=2862460 RepID=UPI001EDFA279|nr:hypothetical protein [Dactylosporangium sp. AC04546]WVK82144.1 hypothetical protein KZZ52_50705 [Dactylosporangium sp. AC04546]